MCTSIVTNVNRTIIGWNLDILGMEYRVRTCEDGVYIEINDAIEGWLPLFGGNRRGEFVAMPTCHPFDDRSNPLSPTDYNVINLNIDLLLMKKTFDEVVDIASSTNIPSVPGVTYMSNITNCNGDVLQIIPGQGTRVLTRPRYDVLTNFSPYKMDSQIHPWMGWDRYQEANRMLNEIKDEFGVNECFEILKQTSQTVCPTVVSMVYDVSNREIFWCVERDYEHILSYKFM